jgi:hypothetical protein
MEEAMDLDELVKIVENWFRADWFYLADARKYAGNTAAASTLSACYNVPRRQAEEAVAEALRRWRQRRERLH